VGIADYRQIFSGTKSHVSDQAISFDLDTRSYLLVILCRCLTSDKMLLRLLRDYVQRRVPDQGVGILKDGRTYLDSLLTATIWP
jgi:hypothetical protein